MGFGDWVAKTFAKASTDVVTSLGDVADRFITTGEDKHNWKMAVMDAERQIKKLVMEGEQMYMKDRQNARVMYMKDSSLQKIFAVTFLIGYILLSSAMILLVFGFFGIGAGVKLEAFQASIISMVFTAMSTKINTIVDFLFGGSKKEDNSEERLAKAFENGTK